MLGVPLQLCCRERVREAGPADGALQRGPCLGCDQDRDRAGEGFTRDVCVGGLDRGGRDLGGDGWLTVVAAG